jgi:hypothetical protein
VKTITQKTASLAASATISAHETVPGHRASSKSLIWSMTSYPRTLPFAGESFSAVPSVASSRMDASQPYRLKQND